MTRLPPGDTTKTTHLPSRALIDCRPSFMRTDAFGLIVAATVFESAACLLLSRYAPKSWNMEVSGSPLWSWWAGAFHQAIVFPAFTLMALDPVVKDGMSLSTWLRIPWSESDVCTACQYLHISLLVYWLKDIVAVKLSAIIWIHHIVCLLSVYASMTSILKDGPAVFALGGTVLELGSLVNSVCELCPGLTIRLCMTPLMALSNCFATALVIWFAWTFEGHGTNIGWYVAAFVGTGLSVLRQREWQGRVRQDFISSRMGKKTQ